jgi:hypothetical protein
MYKKPLIQMFLLAAAICPTLPAHCQAQVWLTATAENEKTAPYVPSAESDDSSESMEVKANRALDQGIEHERELSTQLEKSHPMIETYIQELKPDKALGEIPTKDHYFLGQAEFQGKLKVLSILDRRQTISLGWEFLPAGFLQMAFADRFGLNRTHYKFSYRHRDFLGDVRCYAFDVEPLAKSHESRFVGRIWIEEQDGYIVRLNGYYTPARTFSFKHFDNEYHLHLDSWRTQVRTGEWLPTYIYSQELNAPTHFDLPYYKSATHIWGYGLSQGVHAEELSRVLLENPEVVKDEGTQHDRSPLEAQREWRRQAKNNVLQLLQQKGLLAPSGPVDTVLNTIVNNLLITNNLDGQISLHCRLLLTTNVEVFSVGETIVVSRGLADSVPDEPTLATFLANGVADAMLPKPYQDQYAFSDTVRLEATQVLRKLSFAEKPSEVAENSARAIELLKKSPYATKLGSAGLFLKQLQAHSKQLKHLIEPQLGSQLFFTSQLLQAAPDLQEDDKSQIAALPLGSRLKIEPWNANVSLMKTKSVPLFSPRDKMPFEVTPLVPYLTRYSENPLPKNASPTP